MNAITMPDDARPAILRGIEDVQGNILRGYRLQKVRYLMLKVEDSTTARAKARAFLGSAAGTGSKDVPCITRESEGTPWRADASKRPKYCFNIGLTYVGLRALGVPAASLAAFPPEFIEGMPSRATKLGDVGASAPKEWLPAFKPKDKWHREQPKNLHLIASIYANDDKTLDHIADQVGKAFTVLDELDGHGLSEDKVFFGFRDSIAQPRFPGIDNRVTHAENEPIDPFGTILLGYPTRLGSVRFTVPRPHELGLNGTFNAFRVLRQHVVEFEEFLTRAAVELEKLGTNRVLRPEHVKAIGDAMYNGDAGSPVMELTLHTALREWVAAQLCGRWRDKAGTPVELAPIAPVAGREPDNNFNYRGATACPVGAHIRRANPRSGHIVQRNANNTRRLVRRGMVYGEGFDPWKKYNADDERTKERGLIGNFIGASIGGQFEAVMCDWINLGLHHPSVTGSNDPLIGANDPATSWFDLKLPDHDQQPIDDDLPPLDEDARPSNDGRRYRLYGIPRFVTTRGGAYTFLPSLTAIRYLASLKG